MSMHYLGFNDLNVYTIKVAPLPEGHSRQIKCESFRGENDILRWDNNVVT